jgi:hypothetical protein
MSIKVTPFLKYQKIYFGKRDERESGRVGEGENGRLRDEGTERLISPSPHHPLSRSQLL